MQGRTKAPGLHFLRTRAPPPRSATKRSLFAVAASRDEDVYNLDVKTAIFNAKVAKQMFITLSEVAVKNEVDTVFCLNLALYGTTQAGHLWGIKLERVIKNMGAVRSKVNPCLYTSSHNVVGIFFVLVYVDDVIEAETRFFGAQDFKKLESAALDVSDMDKVNKFITLSVIWDQEAKVLPICNPGNVIALPEAIAMSRTTPNKTPMVAGSKM